jgi:hypothetical protein
MFGFRTLRFFSGALVFTLIATGNGEAVLAGARTAVSITEKAFSSLEQFATNSEAVAKSHGKNTTGTRAEEARRETGTKNRAGDSRAVDHDKHGEYAFGRVEDGQPVRWCAPEIRLLINDSQAPAGALKDFRQAMAQVSVASGIRLHIVGNTDLVADSTSHLRAGDPYPEVLVSWARPHESDLMAAGASGVTTANPARTDAGMRLVTGAVIFNTDHDALYRPGFGKGMTRGNLYLHELIHLLGLGHVDSDELMAATIGADTPAGLSTGDREGLRIAGSC